MRELLRGMLVLLLSIAGAAQATGKHIGEQPKIDAQVTFLNPAGETTADATGTLFRAGSWQMRLPIIYPEQYWGTVPLFFLGQVMDFSVTVTNTTKRGQKPFRLRVEAVSRVLHEDGTQGVEIIPTQEWTIDWLEPGESRTLFAKVLLVPRPDLPSGLDLTTIRLFHLNQGEDDDAALIKEVRAVWCPPDAESTPELP